MGRLVITTPLLNSSSGRLRSADLRLLLSFTRFPHLSWKRSPSQEATAPAHAPLSSSERLASGSEVAGAWAARSLAIWLEISVRKSWARWRLRTAARTEIVKGLRIQTSLGVKYCPGLPTFHQSNSHILSMRLIEINADKTRLLCWYWAVQLCYWSMSGITPGVFLVAPV